MCYDLSGLCGWVEMGINSIVDRGSMCLELFRMLSGKSKGPGVSDLALRMKFIYFDTNFG